MDNTELENIAKEVRLNEVDLHHLVTPKWYLSLRNDGAIWEEPHVLLNTLAEVARWAFLTPSDTPAPVRARNHLGDLLR